MKKRVLDLAAWAARVLPAPIKKMLYKIPFLAKYIRRALNIAAPIEFSEISIAAGAAGGMRMVLNLQAEKDYWLGTYETDLQRAAADLIRNEDVVYDIGANIGFVTLVCANLAGKNGRVFAFEALPANVKRLEKNINANQLQTHVSAIHAAVLDKNGPVTFLTHASGAMGKAEGSAGRNEHYSNSITVPGIALDKYVQDNNLPAPNLIKVDIEGGEGPALEGMRNILAESKPGLLIELHGEEAARQVWSTLTKVGYSIHRMGRGFKQVKSVEDLDWKAYIAAIHKSNPI